MPEDHRPGDHKCRQHGGQETARHQAHQHSQEDQRKGRAVVAQGLRVHHPADQEEVAVVAVGVREVWARLQEEGVAGVEHDVSQPACEPRSSTVYRDNRRVVQGAEVGIADALPDERRGGRYHGLRQHPTPPLRCLVLVAGIRHRHQTRDLFQVDDGAHDPAEGEDVIRFQDVVGLHRRDCIPTADDLDQEQAGEVAQTRLLHPLADQPAPRGHLHLHQVLPRRGADLLEHVGSLRKQPAGEEQQVGNAQQCAGQAHGPDLEEPHGAQSGRRRRIGGRGVCHHSVHHQVGAGTDEGCHAAQNRQVGQRDEKPRGRHPVFGAPLRQQRDEHRHHRRVVEEGRKGRHRQPHPPHDAPSGSHPAQKPPAHQIEGSGLLDSCGHDVESRDRQHAGVGETGEHLLQRENPHQAAGDDRTPEEGVRSHVAGQSNHRETGHRQHEPGGPGHPTSATSTGADPVSCSATNIFESIPGVGPAPRIARMKPPSTGGRRVVLPFFPSRPEPNSGTCPARMWHPAAACAKMAPWPSSSPTRWSS